MIKSLFIFIPFFFALFAISNNRDTKPPAMKTPVVDIQYDGPYVLYRNDAVHIKYILGDAGLNSFRVDSTKLETKVGVKLSIATDEVGKIFSVRLKDKLQIEKSEYQNVNKQLVMSDIEGNFFAFRTLLQSAGVIDKNYNWTFADGHLILLGDFFDRGDQVTELLWLIYSLEDKAKAAGGYVHFVLGNHEIMNLSGDLRYLVPKYINNALLLKENYMDGLLGENSEIGRWLRTKNVMEKVGDVLYTHGGISVYLNKSNTSPEEVNKLARPFYADTTFAYPDSNTELIYSNNGPFWYRGFYNKTNADPVSHIDRILKRYNVKQIVTGHTIIADTVSMMHDGKLFNVDVHHAKGHSEALLIDGKTFYRINAKGQKFILYEKF